jgi:hypothetical protein
VSTCIAKKIRALTKMECAECLRDAKRQSHRAGRCKAFWRQALALTKKSAAVKLGDCFLDL